MEQSTSPKGEAEPLKGPTDVETAREKDTEVALSTLVERLNERFGPPGRKRHR